MKDRPTSDHQRQKLKASTKRSVDRAGGGTVFAGHTRVEGAQLSKYAALSEINAYMPIDVAVDCDMIGGAPIILGTMATVLGYSIAPIESTPGRVTPELVGSLIRETGEVSAIVLETMAAGKLTPTARSAISKEIDEALAALWQLRAAIRCED
ncbi:phage regulatory CII family protein [Mesorhizobium sp. CAU 1732]|uniref:phage regulatory CII family protein n=1 Tax=Mesorhizobium sp. CAU 1732 TaxID=3140358 RepID=UPI0032614A2A